LVKNSFPYPSIAGYKEKPIKHTPLAEASCIFLVVLKHPVYYSLSPVPSSPVIACPASPSVLYIGLS